MAEAAKTMAGPVLLEERAESVATLRMNRPERLNALNVELGRALVEAFRRLGADRNVRAIVLTGVGRAFCSGGDLQLLRDARMRNAGKELEGLVTAGKEICLSIVAMDKPVIASVNGPAAGGGMNLALACDVRIASDKAIFCEAFAQVGLYPDFGGTFFLPRLVGAARAAELFWSAETVPAAEALRLGIVSHVVPAERLEEEAFHLAARLAAAPPMAARVVKQVMVGAARAELERLLDDEIRVQMSCFASEDCAEGLAAFFEKRKPQFRGR